jgi:hypothetical protein
VLAPPLPSQAAERHAAHQAASRAASDRELENEAAQLEAQMLGDDVTFGEDTRDVVGKLQDAAAGVYDKAAQTQAEL